MASCSSFSGKAESIAGVTSCGMMKDHASERVTAKRARPQMKARHKQVPGWPRRKQGTSEASPMSQAKYPADRAAGHGAARPKNERRSETGYTPGAWWFCCGGDARNDKSSTNRGSVVAATLGEALR